MTRLNDYNRKDSVQAAAVDLGQICKQKSKLVVGRKPYKPNKLRLNIKFL